MTERRTWAETAERLGLAYEAAVRGTIEGVPVQVWTEAGPPPCTRLELGPVPAIPSGLAIGPRHADGAGASRPGPAIFQRDIFQRDVLVAGAERVLAALLDLPTRDRILREVVARRLTLKRGKLSCRLPGYVDGEGLEAGVASLVELGRRLALSPADIDRRLLERAAADPEPHERLRCLRAVLVHHGGPRLWRLGPKMTSLALRIAHEDPDPAVRLEAALQLGAKGEGVVIALATDESQPDPIRLRALEQAVCWGAPRRSVALLETLAARSDPVLSRLLLDKALVDPALAVPLAGLLGGIVDRWSESALVQLLESEAPIAKVAVARALGRVGTSGSLSSLRAETPVDEEVRAAVAEAHDAIVERMRIERGGLSIHSDSAAAGALSAAPAAGALSPGAADGGPEHAAGARGGDGAGAPDAGTARAAAAGGGAPGAGRKAVRGARSRPDRAGPRSTRRG